MNIIPYLLAAVVVIAACLMRWRELRLRGNCPRCGTGCPELVGEWGGVEQYRCRNCNKGWDEMDAAKMRRVTS